MTTKMKRIHIILALTLLLPACNRAVAPEVPEGDLIRVGGVEAEVELTKAVDAESIDWLSGLLKEGIDITYGLDKDHTASRLARLTLLDEPQDGDPYSFLYQDVQIPVPGRWMGNGAHFFEGQYVPAELEAGSAMTTLLTDQRDYTQLSRYVSLPPAFTLNATVGRVKLPLRHRLSRVLAYIIIDPALGSGVTIDGYTFPDDPETSKIRFCNVSVLSSVADGTPRWTKARKVIPHFLGEMDVDEYGKVPVYDLIVRPTYTALKNVMYDEDFSSTSKDAFYAATNKIDFEITLSNGLQYTKEFIFDLDANYETVVYLKIGPKSVDYNSSGSELWVETASHDGYYGVNNRNGNNLSIAGGSWQRAYTNGRLSAGVTDGHGYQQDTEDLQAQYVDDATWIQMFAEAYEGGAHHGDYFILTKDIEIPASALPENFVFTGHLDGLDHSLTITGATDIVFDGLNGNYTTAQETTGVPDGEANVRLEKGKWIPYRTATDGWRAELLNTRFALDGGSLIDLQNVTGYLHNCWLGGVRVHDYTPSLPEY